MPTKYETFEVDINSITPSPDNPRKTFDEERLEALKGSIEQVDLTEPIIIRKADGVIIKGERRYRAEKSLGKSTVPVRVYDVDEVVAGEMRLQEEAPINPRELEEAVYKQWIDGSETGRYETRGDMARAIGMHIRTLQRLILAKEERVARSSSSPEIQEASVDALTDTRKLRETNPEARAELLKQKAGGTITSNELRELTEIIAETPDHDSKSAKQIIEEFKSIKEEQKAETKDALKRRKLKADGVEGITITKGTKEYEEFNSETRLLDDYKTTHIRVRSSFRAELLKSMKDAERKKECVNIVWKVYKICQEVLTEMDVDLNE